MARLTTTRRAIIAVAVFLFLFAAVQIWRTDRAVDMRNVPATEIGDGQGGIVTVPPFIIMRPKNVEATPTVVVVHGFSGSKQLMLGYGHSLARSGYEVLLIDLPGHGQHTQPHLLDDSLQNNMVESVLFAQSLWEQASNKTLENVALLGHSMGTGVVLRAAAANPERYKAVIAISPTSARLARSGLVDATTIPNLFLQAGRFEPPFVRNATRWLEAAGGVSAEFQTGNARNAVTIPRVEHMSILFSAVSHRLTINWLAQSFGDVTLNNYVDARIMWYGVGLASTLLVLTMMAPLWRPDGQDDWKSSAERIRRYPLIGLALAAVAAGVGTFFVSFAANMVAFGGVMVGGVLGVWMFFFGLVWLWFVPRPSMPTAYEVALGTLIFVGLYIGFNLLAGRVWLPATLVLPRLWRWPMLAIALLPMQLAAGAVQYPGGMRRRLGWTLAQIAAIFIGLVLAAAIVDGLGFIFLILPLLPVIIGLMTIAGSSVRYPWPFAIGTATWFAYTLMAVFPIAQ